MFLITARSKRIVFGAVLMAVASLQTAAQAAVTQLRCSGPIESCNNTNLRCINLDLNLILQVDPASHTVIMNGRRLAGVAFTPTTITWSQDAGNSFWLDRATLMITYIFDDGTNSGSSHSQCSVVQNQV